jgi:hypothetical protein
MLPVWRVERQKKPTRTTVVTGRRNQLVDEGRPNMSVSISFFFFNKVIDEDDRIWSFVFFQSANPNVVKETTTPTTNNSDWRWALLNILECVEQKMSSSQSRRRNQLIQSITKPCVCTYKAESQLVFVHYNNPSAWWGYSFFPPVVGLSI